MESVTSGTDRLVRYISGGCFQTDSVYELIEIIGDSLVVLNDPALSDLQMPPVLFCAAESRS
jgi:hypothetical protein